MAVFSPIKLFGMCLWGGLYDSDSKEFAWNARDPGSNPWSRKRQPTPVFLTGESHGQRSLAGYTFTLANTFTFTYSVFLYGSECS